MNVETSLAALPLVRSEAEQDEVYVSSVKATVKYLVKVALKTAEYDDFVEIVSKLVDEFQDVIACFAVELTKKLAKLSLPLIDRPGPAHESFVWQSFYGVFTVILNAVKDDRDTVEKIEPSILNVVGFIICARATSRSGVLHVWSSRCPDGVEIALTMEYRSGERTDRSVRRRRCRLPGAREGVYKFYDVVIDVMASLLQLHVCESLWRVYYDLCFMYKYRKSPNNVTFKSELLSSWNSCFKERTTPKYVLDVLKLQASVWT
ncbi:unnamed protein product [Heligmosomoides polygyrus]|uniref:ARM repeat superfamily protein n=1 Tax=Heligmosomoides polygyrus TaxID=6339 RepID=A0A183GNQ6_HELPZ|nr:unnamed protein product [Heligmosomoides polygyrus]